jgi:hypothetical protein
VSRSGIQVLAAVGLGLADPARLASSLVPAGASSAPLVQTAGATRTLPRSWQLRATRGFASGKLTLGAALSQAHAQGPLDRLGDLAAQLELASASPLLQTRAERLEPFLAFTPHATARLELAYTLTAARLRDDEIRTLGGDDELAVHRQAARASLTWTPRPDSSFAFTLRYVGPRHDPATSVALASRIGSTQGSYGSCSVAFRHAFGARWRAFGQVESVVHRDRPTGATAAPPRVRGTIGAEATF